MYNFSWLSKFFLDNKSLKMQVEERDVTIKLMRSV